MVDWLKMATIKYADSLAGTTSSNMKLILKGELSAHGVGLTSTAPAYTTFQCVAEKHLEVDTKYRTYVTSTTGLANVSPQGSQTSCVRIAFTDIPAGKSGYFVIPKQIARSYGQIDGSGIIQAYIGTYPGYCSNNTVPQNQVLIAQWGIGSGYFEQYYPASDGIQVKFSNPYNATTHMELCLYITYTGYAYGTGSATAQGYDGKTVQVWY